MESEYDEVEPYEYADFCSEYCASPYQKGNELQLLRANSYQILKEDQLVKEREHVIEQALELTNLERDDVILVMIYFNWSLDSLRDKWYDDEEGISIKSGIKVKTEEKKRNSNENSKKVSKISCLICELPLDPSFKSLKCLHFFCGECWGEYLSVKMEEFLICLSSTCPQVGCKYLVPESFFLKYLPSKPLQDKFHKAVLKNFTGSNRDLKICPSASCSACIKCDCCSAKEITCLCGTVFCFKCNREAHRPCSCEIVNKWEIKSKSDSANDKWMQANTKSCPHCSQRIEKNQGCNFMLCDKKVGGCGKAFCYVCEVDWEKHSQDHFKCNMYTPAVKAKETKAEQAKVELAKYKFYFDRYINYNNAIQFAEKSRPILESNVSKIVEEKQMPSIELEFLEEALRTVISSKRSLKYTYIFGYYLRDGSEKKLFEYSQGMLESCSDRLHLKIEQDFFSNIVTKSNYEQFNKAFIGFKNDVVNLCSATTKYQRNLLSDIENNMMGLLDEKLINSD